MEAEEDKPVVSDLTDKDLPTDTQETNQDYPVKKSHKKLLIWAGVVLGIIMLMVFGMRLFSAKEVDQKPKPTPTHFQTPTPTPQPQRIDRSQWTLEVLNGSGVTGAAKKVADKLKDLGYQVIKIGNADKDDYTKTQIYVKKELEDKINLVVADLKDAVKIASMAGQLQNSTASARIIIGKE